MTDPWDLNAQIAHRLFGWHRVGWHGDMGAGWHDAAHLWHRTPPAYTTDPAATARVWQWLEEHLPPRWRGEKQVCEMQVIWHRDTQAVTCWIPPYGEYEGATWPAALCRAALALATALDATEGA